MHGATCHDRFNGTEKLSDSPRNNHVDLLEVRLTIDVMPDSPIHDIAIHSFFEGAAEHMFGASLCVPMFPFGREARRRPANSLKILPDLQ